MRVIAIIPVKMNNVRTPGKNTKPFSDGTPLIHLIQKKLLNCKLIDEVYVYCSNEDIKDYLLPGVKYYKRDEQFDTPQADVIEMMRVFSENIEADIYVQAHATTPFLTSESIDKALEEIRSGEYDSSFAVTKLQDFLWQKGEPVNYNPETIPRTQDNCPKNKEIMAYYERLVKEKEHELAFPADINEERIIQLFDILHFMLPDYFYAQIDTTGLYSKRYFNYADLMGIKGLTGLCSFLHHRMKEVFLDRIVNRAIYLGIISAEEAKDYRTIEGVCQIASLAKERAEI